VFLFIFSGGFLTGKMNSEEAGREILIGFNNERTAGQFDMAKVIKDTENQSAVDNFFMIYSSKERMTQDMKQVNKPDVHIKIISPKRSAVLIDSRMWFSSEGAVIGIRSGESWKRADYFTIGKRDAAYIKEQIDYKS
jgi:hypothetical protein